MLAQLLRDVLPLDTREFYWSGAGERTAESEENDRYSDVLESLDRLELIF